MHVLSLSYMTRHPFQGRSTPHAALVDRARAAGLARPAPDELRPGRTAESRTTADVGAVVDRLRRTGPADRGAGRPAEGVRGGRGPAVGAEPAVPPPGPDATPGPCGARGVHDRPAWRLCRADRRRSGCHREGCARARGHRPTT